jgi:glycine dehydrogenase subunit 1
MPTTDSDKQDMLRKIGIQSASEITSGFVPLFNKNLRLPAPLSEQELFQLLTSISNINVLRKYFVGAGCYHHYIPAAIGQLIERGEFLTGYTPYQAEASQGILQAIYEYQSYICILTGMDIANASLYDGPSALSEAIIIAATHSGRKKIVVEEGLHPSYLKVLLTYCGARNLEVHTASTHPMTNINKTSRKDWFHQLVDGNTACVVTQNPDFYGNLRDLDELSAIAHEAGALLIVNVIEPTSLAIIRPPGQFGADIVVGEGQSFGIPMCFGGPSLGFMAVKSFLLKRMPGRICGMTSDSKGKRGFVLTLQAREQHIRRERATSNITTNVALMALSATIYLALMGRSGLKNIAEISMKRAHLLRKKLLDLGFSSLNNNNFYNEFTIKAPALSADEDVPITSESNNENNAALRKGTVTDHRIIKRILSELSKRGIAGGLDLKNGMMVVCCTEMNHERDIEEYESAVIHALRG